MNLNNIQEEIINSNEPHILILAGAGSGKTTTLKHKILNIIENEDISKNKILCITFTKKASYELKERINNNLVDIFTFHSFCYKYLKEYNILKDKKIAFNLDKKFSKKNLLKISILKLKAKISKRKYFKNYNKFLSTNNLIDFDDLLILFLKNINLFNINYKYILVDEFQDTNLIQYEIIKKITKNYTKTIAVGDFDQSIYKFRGANNQIINKYINDYKAKTYILNYNYRSSKEIVETSNELINKNIYRIEKKLKYTIKNNNTEIIYKNLNNYNEIYQDIINNIKKLRTKNIDINKMAILSRNNKELIYLKNYFNNSIYFYDLKPKILTIHQSKGLEFDYCFIIGLEDGNLPSRINNQYLDFEEERRLFYVAITRAKTKLFLYSSKYDLNLNYKEKSIFLNDIDL